MESLEIGLLLKNVEGISALLNFLDDIILLDKR